MSPPCAANAASDNSVVVASSVLLDWAVVVALLADHRAAVGAEALMCCLLVAALDSVLRLVSPAAAVDSTSHPDLDCAVVQSSCLAGPSDVVAGPAVAAAAAAVAADGTADTVHAEAAALVVLHSGSDHPGAYCPAVVHSPGTETSADSCPAAGTVAGIVLPVGRVTAFLGLRSAPFCSPLHRRVEVAAGNCPVGQDASEAVVGFRPREFAICLRASLRPYFAAAAAVLHLQPDTDSGVPLCWVHRLDCFLVQPGNDCSTAVEVAPQPVTWTETLTIPLVTVSVALPADSQTRLLLSQLYLHRSFRYYFGQPFPGRTQRGKLTLAFESFRLWNPP